MKIKTIATGILGLAVLAGCDAAMGTGGGMSVEAGLSYDDFQRQYGVDQATMVAIDANNDGIISENEWQAAGY